MKINIFLSSTFLIFFGLSANATDGLFTSIHHHYQSPRAMGMGDGFVAVANDYSALFYNPAGLAKLEDGQIDMSMDLAISSDYISMYNDIQNAGKTQGTEAQKTQAYVELLQKNYGKSFSLRTGLFQGIWVRPNWGVAILPADLTMDLNIHNQAFPSLSARTYLDTSFVYGYGQDIRNEMIPGRLSWGVSGKVIYRGFFSKDINSLDLVADSSLIRKEDLREGLTVDADLGVLYTPYISNSILKLARPTFGAVVRNVVETGFNQNLHLYNKDNVAGDAPEKLYRVLDVGSRWEYPSFWIFGGRGVLDVRDIGHPNFNMRKGLHAGLEFDWSMASWWKGQYRAGLNQGYLTAGASFLFSILRLDVATYGEDVGSFDNPYENRVYMAKFNIDL